MKFTKCGQYVVLPGKDGGSYCVDLAVHTGNRFKGENLSNCTQNTQSVPHSKHSPSLL
jgi:hypothetical protein